MQNWEAETLLHNTYGDFPGGPVTKTLEAPNPEDPGSIPGQETRSYMAQPRIHMLQLSSCKLQLRPGAAKYIHTYLLKETTMYAL